VRRFPAWIVTFLLAVFACALLGTGFRARAAAPSTPPTAIFVYVADNNSNAISAFQMDPGTGALTAVAGSPFLTDLAPEFLASYRSAFLYVSNAKSNDISAFSVNGASGALTPVPGSPFACGTQPAGITVIASANLLFVANEGSSNVSGFQIDPGTGALSAVSGSPFAAGNGPFGITVNPAGTLLYVNDHLASVVSGYAIGTNGSLTPVPNSPFVTGETPIGIATDPTGKFLYIVDHMQIAHPSQNGIASYAIDQSSGSLTHVAGVLAPPVTCHSACHVNPFGLALHPTKAIAYTTNIGADSVSAYTLAGDGTLSPLEAPLPTGRHPFGIALDPRGKFLYVTNKIDHSVSGFAVHSNGKLSAVAGSPFHTGGGPSGIVLLAAQ